MELLRLSKWLAGFSSQFRGLPTSPDPNRNHQTRDSICLVNITSNNMHQHPNDPLTRGELGSFEDYVLKQFRIAYNDILKSGVMSRQRAGCHDAAKFAVTIAGLRFTPLDDFGQPIFMRLRAALQPDSRPPMINANPTAKVKEVWDGREPLKQWQIIFSHSSLANEAYFVRGSRSLFQNFYGPSRYGTLDWNRLLQTCRRLELPCHETESDSPVNATEVRRHFPFLDGGFFSREGNCFYGLKGSWVFGRKALRFVCYELRIRQPKRSRGEPPIPTYEELLNEIFKQHETNDPLLKQTMNFFDSL
jgi:hypothetical protein